MIDLPGGAVYLTAEEVRLLATVGPAARREWRRGGLVVPPDLDTLLTAVKAAADAGSPDRVPPRSVPCSADVPTLDPASSAAARSGWLTTRSAAEQLGVTDRAVRGLCRRRSLRAQQDGTAWWIDPDSVRRYAARKGYPCAS